MQGEIISNLENQLPEPPESDVFDELMIAISKAKKTWENYDLNSLIAIKKMVEGSDTHSDLFIEEDSDDAASCVSDDEASRFSKLQSYPLHAAGKSLNEANSTKSKQHTHDAVVEEDVEWNLINSELPSKMERGYDFSGGIHWEDPPSWKLWAQQAPDEMLEDTPEAALHAAAFFVQRSRVLALAHIAHYEQQFPLSVTSGVCEDVEFKELLGVSLRSLFPGVKGDEETFNSLNPIEFPSRADNLSDYLAKLRKLPVLYFEDTGDLSDRECWPDLKGDKKDILRDNFMINGQVFRGCDGAHILLEGVISVLRKKTNLNLEANLFRVLALLLIHLCNRTHTGHIALSRILEVFDCPDVCVVVPRSSEASPNEMIFFQSATLLLLQSYYVFCVLPSDQVENIPNPPQSHKNQEEDRISELLRNFGKVSSPKASAHTHPSYSTSAAASVLQAMQDLTIRLPPSRRQTERRATRSSQTPLEDDSEDNSPSFMPGFSVVTCLPFLLHCCVRTFIDLSTISVDFLTKLEAYLRSISKDLNYSFVSASSSKEEEEEEEVVKEGEKWGKHGFLLEGNCGKSSSSFLSHEDALKEAVDDVEKLFNCPKVHVELHIFPAVD